MFTFSLSQDSRIQFFLTSVPSEVAMPLSLFPSRVAYDPGVILHVVVTMWGMPLLHGNGCRYCTPCWGTAECYFSENRCHCFTFTDACDPSCDTSERYYSVRGCHCWMFCLGADSAWDQWDRPRPLANMCDPNTTRPNARPERFTIITSQTKHNINLHTTCSG